jgi:O-antigen ligase
VRRITLLLSLLFIFVVPWEDSITTSTWGSLARIMGLLLAVFWVINIIVEGRLRKPHIFHFLALLFFAWNFVSMYWSHDVLGSTERITTYSQIFLFLLVFWEMFQTPGELKAGLQAYIFGAYVLVGGTFYNYFNGIVAVAYEGRYSATGVNAVDLALSVLLGLPIAMHLFLAAGQNKGSLILKILNIAYLPLAVFAAILTGSRTSLVAILPFLVYVAASSQISLQRKMQIGGILVVALVIALPFVPPTLLGRLGSIGSSIAGEDIGGRVAIWREALGIFARHPIIGIGSGTLDPTIGTAAHNTYISVASETGFVGLILFASVLVLTFSQALRAPKVDIGFWIAVFATWAIGVLSLSWEFRKLTWMILIMVVIGGNLTGQLQAETVRKKIVQKIANPLRRPESKVTPKAAG